MTILKSPLIKTVLKLSLIIVLTIISYSPSLKGGFFFDDYQNIVNNEHVTKFSNIFTFYREKRERMIPFLTYNLQYKLHGLNTFPYHLFNLFLHLVNIIIVYIFTSLLIKKINIGNNTKHEMLPFFTTFLFGLHPLATQSVSYLSQRFNLFAVFFVLLSLIFYLFESKTTLSKAKMQLSLFRICMLTLSLIFSFFAYMSKENAFILPFLLIFLELFPKHQNVKKKILPLSIFFLVLLFAFYFIFLTEKNVTFNYLTRSTTMNKNSLLSRADYLLSQPKAIVTYLGLIILPINQNIDYDYSYYLSKDITTVISIFIIFCLLIIAVIFKRKSPLFTFGIGFFFLNLLIESSIFPIDDIIFEHRTYLPSLGIFISFIAVLLSFAKKKKFRKIMLTFFTIYIFFLFFLTTARNIIWKSEISLWLDTVKKSPYKGRPYANLASSYLEKGIVSLAIINYEKAIQLDPNLVDAYQNLANIYQNQKDLDKATKYFELAAQIPSKKQIALKLFLAKNYISQKQVAKAKEIYLEILKLDSNNAQAYNSLGVLAQLDGNNTEALKNYNKAVTLDVSYENAYFNLTKLYQKQKEIDKACDIYNIILLFKPDDSNTQKAKTALNCPN